jgi:hypothetical protein
MILSINLFYAMKKIFLIPVAAVFLASCIKEDFTACPAEVRFVGDITEITAETRVQGANGESWTQGDHTGIYMIRANPGTIDAANVLAANMPYNASTTSSNSPLVPVASAIFLPDDDTEVRFVAYFPYDRARAADDYRYEIELFNQSNQSVIDLLWAFTDQSYKKSTATTIPLRFRHTLVKLVFTVAYGEGTTAPADNAITIAISNQYPVASLNLRTGYSTGMGSLTELTSTGTTARVEAIVVPEFSTRGTVFTVTNAVGDKFEVAAPQLDMGWTGGSRYTYNIVLRGDRVAITGNIDPWVDSPNSTNGNVDVIYGSKI